MYPQADGFLCGFFVIIVGYLQAIQSVRANWRPAPARAMVTRGVAGEDIDDSNGIALCYDAFNDRRARAPAGGPSGDRSASGGSRCEACHGGILLHDLRIPVRT
jgi:hypothetical protein